MQAAARFRTQHRKTTDGRLCAAAGVQGEQTFTGCTTAVLQAELFGEYVDVNRAEW